MLETENQFNSEHVYVEYDLPIGEGGAAVTCEIGMDCPQISLAFWRPKVPAGMKVPVIAEFGPYFGETSAQTPDVSTPGAVTDAQKAADKGVEKAAEKSKVADHLKAELLKKVEQKKEVAEKKVAEKKQLESNIQFMKDQAAKKLASKASSAAQSFPKEAAFGMDDDSDFYMDGDEVDEDDMDFYY